MFVITGGVSIIISVLVFLIMLLNSANKGGFNLNLIRYMLHLFGWIVILLTVCLMGQKLSEAVRIALAYCLLLIGNLNFF